MFVENFVHFSQSYDIKALFPISGPFTDASLLYNLISINLNIRKPESIDAGSTQQPMSSALQEQHCLLSCRCEETLNKFRYTAECRLTRTK